MGRLVFFCAVIVLVNLVKVTEMALAQDSKANGASAESPGESLPLEIIKARVGVGYITSKYKDTQTNLAEGSETRSMSANLTGQKYFAEAILWETIWLQFDLRSATSNQKNWKKRDEGQFVIGPAFTFLGLIVPVIGIHSEENKVDLDKRDSAKVAHLDHRVPVAGVFTRQDFYQTDLKTGVPDKMQVYATGSWLLFNPGETEASHGSEITAGVGVSYKLSLGRVDMELGVGKQSFTGVKKPSVEDPREMKIDTAQQSTFIQTGLWF